MNIEVLLLIFCGLAAGGFWVWTYAQQKGKLLQTQTVEFAGGSRFEAHRFTVEMHQASKRVKISAQPGVMSVTPLKAGAPPAHDGALDLYVPAAGLSVELVRSSVVSRSSAAVQASSSFEIVFTAADVFSVGGASPGQVPSTATPLASTAAAGAALSPSPLAASPAAAPSAVRLQGLPDPVARDFQAFASRLNIWAAKVTKFAEHEKAQKEAEEAAAAAAAAAEAAAQEEAAKAAVAKEANPTLDLAGQIAHWRKQAGFSGQHSEVGTHDKGGINWFIDLDPQGRITLHSNKRTVFTTLQGASITALAKSIEIGVRDEYWSDGDPLTVFEVLQDSPPNERRTWKELLEDARDRLEISLRKGY
jgi:hypothetical protein